MPTEEVPSKVMVSVGKQVTQEEGERSFGMPESPENKGLRFKTLLYKFDSFIKGQKWMLYIGCSTQ